MTNIRQKIQDALTILNDLGMPRQQLNERSAYCLLALVNIDPEKGWHQCEAPLMGITPIMDWSRDNYNASYAPNSRETFRRQSVHQFIQAGICLYNPDKPDRAVNSPAAVYQIEPNLLEVLKTFGTESYATELKGYLSSRKTLVEQYAKAREMEMIPLVIKGDNQIQLSPGEHSKLIESIVNDFGSRFAPGGEVLYVGDTGDKYGFFDKELLHRLGVNLDSHGKMPDVVIFMRENNWLLLIESVTTHGPVDSKRHDELSKLFEGCTAGLVFISAFPNRKVFLKYLESIAWESEVWIADAPSHLIHFNGVRFLGPYNQPK